MLNDNHYTKEAYEDNGRFQIHPLSAEGFEAYLSKDSYNYHFLKSKYDPALLKEVEEEMKAKREQQQNKLKNQNQNQNQNYIENKKIENPKIEDMKPQNNLPLNANKGNSIQAKKSPPKNNNVNVGVKKGTTNKVNNKGNNNIRNKPNVGNNNTKKVGNIKGGVNPVISNVHNDSGRLRDFQQPYHA